MGYSRNFGFRSFENIVRMARHRTPDSGSQLVIGSPVEVDPANEGRLRQAGAALVPHPGCGILLYEHIQYQGDDPFLTTASDKDTVPLNSYAQIVRGNGVKVWFKNTEEKTLYDGRTQAARTMVAVGATPSVGEYLTPAGDGTWQEGTAANGWLWIEQADFEGGFFECRLTF